MGVGVGAIAASDKAIVIPVTNKSKKATIIEKEKEKENEIDLVKVPWDIRDAILRRDKLRAENECFYWIYKSLPGGGKLERFRRSRDCDEYDYDL